MSTERSLRFERNGRGGMRPMFLSSVSHPPKLSDHRLVRSKTQNTFCSPALLRRFAKGSMLGPFLQTLIGSLRKGAFDQRVLLLIPDQLKRHFVLPLNVYLCSRSTYSFVANFSKPRNNMQGTSAPSTRPIHPHAGPLPPSIPRSSPNIARRG